MLASCVTQKKKDEQDLSLIGKWYHNTTAHYNGYFNAEELYKESLAQLNEQNQNNFNEVLPVYPFLEIDNPQAVADQLDKATEKLARVVSLHRQSKWTDDCYLLVGKAQYLKQDYESAEETFRYLIDEFEPEPEFNDPDDQSGEEGDEDQQSDVQEALNKEGRQDFSDLSKKELKKLRKKQEKERKRRNRQIRKNKKRKKSKKKPEPPQEEEAAQADSTEAKPVAENQVEPEEETEEPIGMISIMDAPDEAAASGEGPDDGLLQHRPAYQEGKLWLARTLIERDKYSLATRLLNQLEQDPGTYKDVRREVAVAKAHQFIRLNDYASSLAALEDAIQMANDRQKKARYAFIIAQLGENLGQRQRANEAFRRVLTYGPDYEMEFNARLSIVRNGWESGAQTPAQAQSELENMLADIKNEDYQDQLYFTLANIELKDGDRQTGIEYLQKSLDNSRQNTLQRAESYLRLADLYMEEENFLQAEENYANALETMPTNDERYNRVQRLRNNLEEIAENIKTVQLQDSLLKIAAMSDKEQRELAFAIKKKEQQERLERISQQANGQGGGNSTRATRTARGVRQGGGRVGIGSRESSFFAYDDKTVKRGNRQFISKWGNRDLRDNWRRSNAQQSEDFDADIAEEEFASEALTEQELAEVLANVPQTQSEMLAAKVKVQEALFNLGTLYRERLENNEKAVEALETLNDRFPASNFELDSWYYLYLAHQDLGNNAKAQNYANKILEKYPGTTYANVIQDPNYAQQMQSQQERLNAYYDEAYNAYQNGKYQLAYQKTQEVGRKFGSKNTMKSKFALLTALCTGNLQGKAAYINALKEVVARYPDTPEERRANEILRLLGVSGASLPGRQQEQERKFKVEDQQLHYFIIVFKGDVALNEAKIALSQYHQQYHKLDNLSFSNLYLGQNDGERSPMLIVRRFRNKKEAMKYYYGVQRNRKDFLDPQMNYEYYVVSQNNYREILRTKSVEGYPAFFQNNYLR